MVQIEGIESWTPKDFVNFIVYRLGVVGVVYKPKYPFDVIMVGRLTTAYRKQGRSNYALKAKLEEIFQSFEFKQVHSLQFLYNLAKPPAEQKTKEERLKDREAVVSDDLKMRLEALKNELEK